MKEYKKRIVIFIKEDGMAVLKFAPYSFKFNRIEKTIGKPKNKYHSITKILEN